MEPIKLDYDGLMAAYKEKGFSEEDADLDIARALSERSGYDVESALGAGFEAKAIIELHRRGGIPRETSSIPQEIEANITTGMVELPGQVAYGLDALSTSINQPDPQQPAPEVYEKAGVKQSEVEFKSLPKTVEPADLGDGLTTGAVVDPGAWDKRVEEGQYLGPEVPYVKKKAFGTQPNPFGATPDPTTDIESTRGLQGLLSQTLESLNIIGEQPTRADIEKLHRFVREQAAGMPSPETIKQEYKTILTEQGQGAADLYGKQIAKMYSEVLQQPQLNKYFPSDAWMTKGVQNLAEGLTKWGEDYLYEHPEYDMAKDIQETDSLRGAWSQGGSFFARYLAAHASRSLPQLVSNVGINAAATLAGQPALGMALSGSMMGLLESGSSMKDLLDMGVGRDDAADISVVVGAVNGILEQIPMDGLFNHGGGKMFRKLLGDKIMHSLAGNPQYVKRLMNSFIGAAGQIPSEGITEGMQEVVSNSAKAVFDENQDIFQGAPTSMVVGALMGGFSGAGSGLVQTPGKGKAEGGHKTTTTTDNSTSTIATDVPLATAPEALPVGSPERPDASEIGEIEPLAEEEAMVPPAVPSDSRDWSGELAEARDDDSEFDDAPRNEDEVEKVHSDEELDRIIAGESDLDDDTEVSPQEEPQPERDISKATDADESPFVEASEIPEDAKYLGQGVDFEHLYQGKDGKFYRSKEERPEVKAEVEPNGEKTVLEGADEAATSPTNDLPEPTEAQKEAGNYKVGRVKLAGMDISIENPKGSVRKGTDDDGKQWETEMQHHYGYIKGTVGYDKDHLDVFLTDGSEEQPGKAFVVDQDNPETGEFDEHKVVIGPETKQEALEVYQANYEEGWQGAAGITEMPMDEFKEWSLGNGPKNGRLSKEDITNGEEQQEKFPKEEPQEEVSAEVQKGEVKADLPSVDTETAPSSTEGEASKKTTPIKNESSTETEQLQEVAADNASQEASQSSTDQETVASENSDTQEAPLKIAEHGKDAILVQGDTKAHKTTIKAIGGGIYNKSKKGWQFSKKHEEKVRGALGELVAPEPEGKPYEERGKRKLLLHVARAADAGTSTPFVGASDNDRADNNWRSGQSSSDKNISEKESDVKATVEDAGEELGGARAKTEDVPYDLAYDAYRGISMSPEKRAKSEQLQYVENMKSEYSKLQKMVRNKEEQQILDNEFERYRIKYLEKLKAKLQADSRTMSAMVTGPANFPTRSNQQKLKAADKRLNELFEYHNKAITAIKKKLRPELAPIKSSDVDAVSKLQKKLDEAIKAHDLMKAANAVIRSKKDVDKKLGELGLSEKMIKEIQEPDYAGKAGFAAYALQNSNANIKRLRDRIKEVEKKQNTESSEHVFDGGAVELNTEDDRLRIIFDDKPDADLRSRLKSKGFRWSPKNNAWQRQITHAAKYAATDLVGVSFETKETDQGVALFTRSTTNKKAPKFTTPMVTGKVLQVVKSLKLDNVPPITVVQSENSLPQIIQDKIKTDKAEGEVSAVFHQGKVWVVSDNIHSASQVRDDILHEVLGHFGLRGLLGDKLNPVLDQVADHFDLSEIADTYGLNLNTDKGRRIAAEEKLSFLQQDDSARNMSFAKKVYAKIRALLRQLGFIQKMTDADISHLLSEAYEFARTGKPTNQPTWQGAVSNEAAFSISDKGVNPLTAKETIAKGMLRPATIADGEIRADGVGNTHYDLTPIVNAKAPQQNGTGFMTPDNKFLTRHEALSWLKENRPKVYSKLDPTTKENGLESQAYAYAEGIATKINQEAESFMERVFGADAQDMYEPGDVLFSRKSKDTDYLAAVERGDIKTVKKMVDEAAKAAGIGTIKPTSYLFADEVRPLNPVYDGREEHVRLLAKQFSERGWEGRPIVVIGTQAITGSHRVAAAQEAGIDIPVVEMAEQTQKDFNNWYKTTEEATFGFGLDSFSTIDDSDRSVDVSNAIDSGVKGLSDIYDLLRVESFSNDNITFKGQAGDINVGDRQIKSADPVTYDDNGDVIPLSERFNQKKDDIRFSRRSKPEGGKITAQINTETPGMDLRYDGAQLNLKDELVYHQFTIYGGPATGATFAVKKLESDLVQAAADKKVSQFVGDAAFSRKSKEPDTAKGKSLFPEVQERLDSARGAKADTLSEHAKNFLEKIKHGARHFPLLDPKKWGNLTNYLRVFEDVPNYSKYVAEKEIKGFIKTLDPGEYDVFRMNIILSDMLKDVDSGLLDGSKELPFGYANREQLKADIENFQKQANGKVLESLEKRREFMDGLKRDLIKAKLLNKENLQDEAYYHHQVLQYLALRNKGTGTSTGDVRLKKKGWQKGRTGSTLDYNTEYVEAEFTVVAQGIAQLETKKVMDRIDREHNTIGSLRAAAKKANTKTVYKALKYDPKDISNKPEDDPFSAFRKKMAIAFGKLGRLASDGKLPQVPADLRDAAEAFSQWRQVKEDIKEAVDDKMDPFISHPDTFRLLSYLINKGDKGAVEAAMIYKAMSERKRFVSETLGDKELTWQNLVDKETQKVWKPKPFTAWYMTNSISDKVVETVIGGQRALQTEDVQMTLTRGADVEWVLPVELADTLDNFRDFKDEGVLSEVSQTVLNRWKQWILINPYRYFKYNLNNMSGDLDIVFAYQPKIITKHFSRAAKDLFAQMRGNDLSPALTKELDLAMQQGVITSSMSAHDIPDITTHMEVEKHIRAILPKDNSKGLKRVTGAAKDYWLFAKKTTAMRENILRLAAFRFFQEQLAQGKQAYGVSPMVKTKDIGDKTERAAMLARDLLGDYGNLSQTSQWLRKHLIPFWSWQAINAPRYVRLFKNMKHDELQTGKKGAVVGAGAIGWQAGKLSLKTAALFTMVNLWNMTVWPEEEEELGESGRRQLHIILGRRDDGSIISIRFQGALSDALSWFALEDIDSDIKDLVTGKANWGEKAKEAALAPAQKVVGASRPLLKTASEATIGLSFYPDFLSPRPVRDKMAHILRTFSMDKAYNLIAGKPKPEGSYVDQLAKDLLGVFAYSTDPGVMAYYDTRKLAFDFMEKATGKSRPTIVTTDKSNALYYYKQALRLGDVPAAARYLRKYIKLGGKPQYIKTSIKAAHPLAGVPKKYRGAFLKSLAPKERERYNRALKFYVKSYWGRKK